MIQVGIQVEGHERDRDDEHDTEFIFVKRMHILSRKPAVAFRHKVYSKMNQPVTFFIELFVRVLSH